MIRIIVSLGSILGSHSFGKLPCHSPARGRNTVLSFASKLGKTGLHFTFF